MIVGARAAIVQDHVCLFRQKVLERTENEIP